MAAKLASYERPPVVEVVMGVQFQALSALLSPHTGLFWETIRDQYPKCREVATLVEQKEDFSGNVQAIGLNIAVEEPQVPRLWFEDDNGEWLVQLQRDRFLHNWRLTSKRPYPRYKAVKPAFLVRWKQFLAFVRKHKLGTVVPNQYEITYLNHIGLEEAPLGDMFPDFRWNGDGKTIRAPDSTAISCVFTAPDRKRRLRTSIRPARHKERGSIIVFELTVRGFDNEVSLGNWFDAGREWIVTAFDEMTSSDAHKQWGRSK
jgi:uncharacterized protein (TIGR04255 family)